MSYVKAAVLGAGSFAFGPSLLKDAIAEHRLDGLELAMVDPNDLTLELTASVGRRMARELGVNLKISTHARRESALDGAEFVICAATIERQRRFATDCAIIARHSPGHRITTLGGIAGLSYSLRQIALIQEICADMRRLCPNAWLLNLADPLPRVCQAAHEEGLRTVGFCSISLAAYGRIWKILFGEALKYPFLPARERLDLTMGGLSHFSWVLDVHDLDSGQDRYPSLREAARRPGVLDEPIVLRLLAETGYLPALGDDRIQDFLPAQESSPSQAAPYLSTIDERQARIELMRDVVEGRAPWQELLDREAWEKPMDLVAAMICGRTRPFPALNLINRGQVPGLPPNVFVETPAIGTTAGPIAQKVAFPEDLQPPCQRTAMATDAVVRAARQQDRRQLYEAIELDPTITDKRAGRFCIDACLAAHQDILPAYR